MPTYTVHVSNIGNVHTGTSKDEAQKIFDSYAVDSRTTVYGRVSGETVTLFEDGEILDQWEN